MEITIGSNNLEEAAALLMKFNQLIPALEFSHREVAPGAQLNLLNEKIISCAICRSDLLPADLPDEIDSFSFAAGKYDLAHKKIHLSLLFQRQDKIWPLLRNLFLESVVFAGAGIGGTDNVTLGVVNALKGCEVCVYDALIPDGIIDFLPDGAEKIFVGKRNGRHSMKQDEINRLLVQLAKSGKKTVRLKGGDPSIFGRLAEETGALQQERLPFRVLPGVTSLSVAAANCGLMPTRRGSHRGFSVATPRRAGSHNFVPLNDREEKESFKVYYMAAGLVDEITATMVNDGFSPNWPIALVYDAGNSSETVVCGTLADISSKISAPRFKQRPALVLTGKGAAENYLFKTWAPLEKRKIICLGAKNLFVKAKRVIEGYGGLAVFSADKISFKSTEFTPEGEYDGFIDLDRDQIREDVLQLAAHYTNRKIEGAVSHRESLSCVAV